MTDFGPDPVGFVARVCVRVQSYGQVPLVAPAQIRFIVKHTINNVVYDAFGAVPCCTVLETPVRRPIR